MRRFVADASHELRTPLTSIRGYAELFRTGLAPDTATRDQAISRIESEGARMSKLVEDLLLLARLDQRRSLDMEPVDIVSIVSDVVMDARVIDQDRSITFTHPDEAVMLGDEDRLRQVVVNLLTNARVHTGPNVSIHVAIESSASEIELRVADDGPGMNPADAERAFDRFYRVDDSRARTSGGSGLGLSIVRSIVEAHRGRARLETRPGDGTTAVVALPRFTVTSGTGANIPVTSNDVPVA